MDPELVPRGLVALRTQRNLISLLVPVRIAKYRLSLQFQFVSQTIVFAAGVSELSANLRDLGLKIDHDTFKLNVPKFLARLNQRSGIIKSLLRYCSRRFQVHLSSTYPDGKSFVNFGECPTLFGKRWRLQVRFGASARRYCPTAPSQCFPRTAWRRRRASACCRGSRAGCRCRRSLDSCCA
jgi:hypothetical protein